MAYRDKMKPKFFWKARIGKTRVIFVVLLGLCILGTCFCEENLNKKVLAEKVPTQEKQTVDPIVKRCKIILALQEEELRNLEEHKKLKTYTLPNRSLYYFSEYLKMENSKFQAKDTKTTFSSKNTRTIQKPFYFGAISEDLLKKAETYLMEEDIAALQKLLATKSVFLLDTGLEVYFVETRIFSNRVKIRPVGEIIEIWTIIEALN